MSGCVSGHVHGLVYGEDFCPDKTWTCALIACSHMCRGIAACYMRYEYKTCSTDTLPDAGSVSYKACVRCTHLPFTHGIKTVCLDGIGTVESYDSGSHPKTLSMLAYRSSNLLSLCCSDVRRRISRARDSIVAGMKTCAPCAKGTATSDEN